MGKLQICVLALGMLLLLSDTSIAFPDGLPNNFQEYKSRYQRYATTPEGAVKMYFDAVFCYINQSTRAEAIKMLRYSMHEKAGWESSHAYATFVSRLKDPYYHYIFRSFAEGTSPQNDYAMSTNRYHIMIDSKRPQSDYLQINLISSGADSPRITHAQKFDDGLWYMTNIHGTYSDVRQPASYTNRNAHDADYD